MSPALGFEPTTVALIISQLQSGTHPDCSELMELLRSWDSLPDTLRTAIMAIVRTAKDTSDQ